MVCCKVILDHSTKAWRRLEEFDKVK